MLLFFYTVKQQQLLWISIKEAVPSHVAVFKSFRKFDIPVASASDILLGNLFDNKKKWQPNLTACCEIWRGKIQ